MPCIRLVILAFTFDNRVKRRFLNEDQRAFMGISAAWDVSSVDSSFLMMPTHSSVIVILYIICLNSVYSVYVWHVP